MEMDLLFESLRSLKRLLPGFKSFDLEGSEGWHDGNDWGVKWEEARGLICFSCFCLLFFSGFRCGL